MKVEIKIQDFKDKVAEGYSEEELMSFYNIDEKSIKSILKELKLKIKHKTYKLVD